MEQQSKTVNIEINPENKRGRIGKYIYSHFAENLGKGFYEGIWVGKDSDIPNDDGIRLDVVNALKELELPCLRLPGGNFADNYHWQDGIGPMEKRPVRFNANWGLVDNNAFGTHEYVKFCNMIGAEPYFCANVGSGTVEEARAWVEYCNLKEETTLTKMRAANGHPEPFNVKFWAVGNEVWGCGGKMSPEYYSDVFKQYAFFMKLTDPDIKLVISGAHGELSDWDEKVLEKTYKSDLVDLLGFHSYFGNISDINYTDDQYYSIVSQVESMKKKLKRVTGLCRAYSTYGRAIKVAFDEWGMWYREGFDSYLLNKTIDQKSTMLDGIFTGLAFHTMHEFNEELYMANGSETVNALQALIITNKEKMCVTPTYYVYKLFKTHKEGMLLESKVEAPALKIGENAEAPSVSASSTLSEDGLSINVSLVNISLDKAQEVSIRIKDVPVSCKAAGEVLCADEVRHYNKPGEKEKIYIKALETRQEADAVRLLMPPHSVAMVRCRIRQED